METRTTFTDDPKAQDLLAVLSKELGVDIGDINPDSVLYRDLAADSLKIFCLTCALEKRFRFDVRTAVDAITKIFPHETLAQRKADLGYDPEEFGGLTRPGDNYEAAARLMYMTVGELLQLLNECGGTGQ